MNIATTNALIRASGYAFATYADNSVAETSLRPWLSQAGSNEIHQVEKFHDCLAVIHKIDVSDNATVDDLPALVKQLRATRLPKTQQLGQTSILVIQVDCENNVDEVLRQLNLCDTRTCAGGRLAGGGFAYDAGDDLLVFIGTDDTIRLLLRFVYEQVRMIESLRHKVLKLFLEYSGEYRDQFLAAGETLRHSLERMNQLCGSHESDCATLPRHEDVIGASKRITEAYCGTLLLQGPVKQIEAMLAANLRNLCEVVQQVVGNGDRVTSLVPGEALLLRRSESLQMLSAQLTADLGLVSPVLEAAQCVAQSYHGQLLAELTATEAKENRQRATDGERRDAYNMRITWLAMWLGISQLWLGWFTV